MKLHEEFKLFETMWEELTETETLAEDNSDGEIKEYGVYVDTGYGLDFEMIIKARSADEAYDKARKAGYGKYVRIAPLTVDDSLL